MSIQKKVSRGAKPQANLIPKGPPPPETSALETAGIIAKLFDKDLFLAPFFPYHYP